MTHIYFYRNVKDVEFESFAFIECKKGVVINRRSSKISHSWSYIAEYRYKKYSFRRGKTFRVHFCKGTFTKGKSFFFSIFAHKISDIILFEVLYNYSKRSIGLIQGAIQLAIVTFWREIVSFAIRLSECSVCEMLVNED